LAETKRILVVDDEPLARQRVVRYLKRAALPLLVAEAGSGLEAVERIREFGPDLVFLDVEMPGLSGFEVLGQFDVRQFSVVFVTAYDEFAVRAFEENACDYLLKPFTAERLLKALDRALARAADEKRLRALEAAMAGRDGYLRRLTVKQGTRLRVVEEREILYLVSRDHCTCVALADGREGIADLSLRRLAERLDPALFARLHRNNIVGVAAVAALTTLRDGSMWVEMRDGTKLPVARSRRRAARALLSEKTNDER
jgi:two-component system LytT family response regulator